MSNRSPCAWQIQNTTKQNTNICLTNTKYKKTKYKIQKGQDNKSTEIQKYKVDPAAPGPFCHDAVGYVEEWVDHQHFTAEVFILSNLISWRSECCDNNVEYDDYFMIVLMINLYTLHTCRYIPVDIYMIYMMMIYLYIPIHIDVPVHNSTAEEGEAQKSWTWKLENLKMIQSPWSLSW